MKIRQWLLCLALTFAAGLGWAQDKVVYHFDDTATQALKGLRNVRTCDTNSYHAHRCVFWNAVFKGGPW